MSPVSDSEKERRAVLVTAVTVVRIPIAVAFAVSFLLMTPSLTRAWIGLILLGAIEASDMLDGLLARRLKATSEWGATLDPYADSFSRLVVYWTLAVGGVALAAVPLVMALRDVTVAYCRISLARQGRTVAAHMSGKIKAVVQGAGAMLLVGGPIYLPLVATLIGLIVAGPVDQNRVGTWTNMAFSWIVIVVTAWSIIDYVRAAAGKTPKEPQH